MSTLSRRGFLGGAVALAAGTTATRALPVSGPCALPLPSRTLPADEVFEVLLIAIEAVRRATVKAEEDHTACHGCLLCGDASMIAFNATIWQAMFESQLWVETVETARRVIAQRARPTVVDRPYPGDQDEGDFPLTAAHCRQGRQMATGLIVLMQILDKIETLHADCDCELCQDLYQHLYPLSLTVAGFLDGIECGLPPATVKIIHATFRCLDPKSDDWQEPRDTDLPVDVLRSIAVQLARECL
jgi:hypothetical protein